MRRTRWIALLLCLTLLAGCSPRYTEPEAQESGSFRRLDEEHFLSGGFTFPLKEQVTYTFLVQPDALTQSLLKGDIGKNSFWQELERRTNVHFDFVPLTESASRESYLDNLPASRLCDVITLKYFDFPSVGDERFLDLTELLPLYAPDYLAALRESGEEERVAAGGRHRFLCSVVRGETVPSSGFLIRQDWLEELDLGMPETYEDWETVLDAFQTVPGCEAPLVLTAGNFLRLGAGMGLYVDIYGDSFYLENGKVRNSFLDNPAGCRAYLELLYDWYKKGYINRDFLVSDQLYPDHHYLAEGAAGIGYAMYSQLENEYASLQGNLTGVPFPVLTSGASLEYLPGAVAGKALPSVMISAACKQPEILLAVFNYLFTEEGFRLSNYGIEGVDYTLSQDGSVSFSPEMRSDLAAGLRTRTLPPSWGPCWYDQDRQLLGLPEYVGETVRVWATGDKQILPTLALTEAEAEEFRRLYTGIKEYIQTSCISFVGERRVFAQWENFEQELSRRGLERCVEIYQTAYDRQLDRAKAAPSGT